MADAVVLGMPQALSALSVTKKDRLILSKWERGRVTPNGLARRARIILLASQGRSNRQIGLQVGCGAHVVGQWRRRYQSQGLAGLEDRSRPGRPTTITAAQKREIVARVCSAPPAHLSRWSVRTLAREMGYAPSVIHLILQQHDLHPHRLRTFNFSPDPCFKEKLLEVVGIYMKPPENAVVLCVDEKTGIQALDRTQPMLPMRAGKPRCWSNEYVRHGTRTLLAALEIDTGKVTAHVRDNRRSETFLKFMDRVAANHPKQRMCVVMDNLNIHCNKAAQEWLARHPRVSFHYTPTHASWVNLIECFFSILTRQGLQQAVHFSTRDLTRFLKDYVRNYNRSCGPFTWTKGPKKLKRIIELTKEFQASYVTN
jgi:transposase